MDNLQHIIERLEQHSGLMPSLSVSGLLQFVKHASQLKKDIALTMRVSLDHIIPPVSLPPSIHLFLSQATSIEEAHIQPCWDALKDLCWDEEYHARLEEHPENAFRRHGVDKGLSASTCLLFI